MSEKSSAASGFGDIPKRGGFRGLRGRLGSLGLRTFLEADIRVKSRPEVQQGIDLAKQNAGRLAEVQSLTESRKDALGDLARAVRALQEVQNAQSENNQPDFGGGERGYSGVKLGEVQNARLSTKVILRKKNTQIPGAAPTDKDILVDGIGRNPLIPGDESQINRVQIVRMTTAPGNPEDPTPRATSDAFSILMYSTTKTAAGERQCIHGIGFDVSPDGEPIVEIKENFKNANGGSVASRDFHASPEDIGALAETLNLAAQTAALETRPPEF